MNLRNTRTSHVLMTLRHDMMACHCMTICQAMMTSNATRTRPEMMTCQENMTSFVSVMAAPQMFLFFLLFCFCAAIAGGPRGADHLLSRRSTLPRKLHIHPAGLTYDAAPHRPDHLHSRLYISPRKLHINRAWAVSDAARRRPVHLLNRRSNPSWKFRIPRAGCGHDAAPRTADYLLSRHPNSPESCIYILRVLLTMQPRRDRSSIPASI